MQLHDNDRKKRLPGEARRPTKGAPLGGLLFDSAGHPMSPVKVPKPNAVTYHYYVSTVVTTGRARLAGAVPRLAAPLIEEIIAKRMSELNLINDQSITPDWTTIRDVIERIEVGSDTITILFDEERLQVAARDLKAEVRVPIDRLMQRGGSPMSEIKVRLLRKGGTMVAIGPQGQAAVCSTRIDPALSAALVRAESWKRRLLSGEITNVNAIAEAENVSGAFVRRMILPAFLAPDLKAAIMDGRQSLNMTLETVTRSGLPIDWTEQRRLYAA